MPNHILNEKPDVTYIKKVWRRQRVPALIMGLSVFAIGFSIALTTKNVYRSSISVVLDPRDMFNEPFSGKAWANATQRNFTIKFQSQDFIQRIIAEAKIKDNPGVLSSFFNRVKNSFSAGDKSSREKLQNIALIRKLAKAMIAENERDDGALALYVDWESPEEAQRIATHGMDLWILSEIEDETVLAKRRLEGLLAAPWGQAAEITGEAKTDRAKNTEPSANKYQDNANPIEDARKVDELNRQIQNISEQLASENTQLRGRRVDLQVDLERLRSKFEQTHPEIEARESELKSLKDASAESNALTAELEKKRRELVAIKMRSGLGPVSPMISSPTTSSTAATLAQLQAYIALLERQIAHPELRAKFNVIKAATYETAAFQRRKLTMAVFALALSILLALALVVYREYNNHLARDAWRVEASCQIPVWGQISEEALRKNPEINLTTADVLREKLGHSSELDEDSRTLLGYRKIEIAIRRRCTGRVVVLIEGSSKSDLRGFYTSLINIMSSDMAGKILFIDTNHVTPIYAETSNQGFLEIIEKFTQNDSSWDSLIQKSEKNDLLFDFISSGAPPKGLKTRLYNELGLKRIFAELQKSYDLVIVRGLPETHFVENSALASVSSDILMVVDSKTTSIPQISRSINQLGESPIRGVILVGT